MIQANTVAELKKSGYKPLTVRQEMRKNLIVKLQKGENLFPGIIGYDDTVVPALLAQIDLLRKLARQDR